MFALYQLSINIILSTYFKKSCMCEQYCNVYELKRDV